MTSPFERGGRVLLLSEIPFWRRDTGVAQRIASLCESIASAGFELRVFYPDRIHQAEWPEAEQSCAGYTISALPLTAAVSRAIRRRVGGLLGKSGLGPTSLPIAFQRPWHEERAAALHRLVRRFQPRVVVVEYLLASALLDGLSLPEGMPHMVIDTIDVLSERDRRFRTAGLSSPLAVTPEAEAEMLNRYDVLLAIQNEEAEQLRNLCPGKRVLTVGHGHTIDPLPIRDHATTPRLLFLGSPATHNRVALQVLLDAVWPRVSERLPHAELLLAGGICDHLPSDLPNGVQVVGRVEAPRDAYALADVVINPAMVGSGLKIKNVEALCHGLPLVTSHAAAEGMREGAGTAFLVAETPEALADTAIGLLESIDRRRALALEALNYARHRLSPHAAAEPLLELLREACYRPKN